MFIITGILQRLISAFSDTYLWLIINKKFTSNLYLILKSLISFAKLWSSYYLSVRMFNFKSY
jgi:hypothetical protein